MRLWVLLAALAVVFMWLLAGCASQVEKPLEKAQQTAGEEEIEQVEETTQIQLPAAALESAPESDIERVACQSQKALADLGPERAQELNNKIVEEVLAGEARNIQEAYAERGYSC